jgi:CheY-like chemotaxis protein
MTGGIAHDFNNLLTAVMGNLELASKRVQDRPPVADMLLRAALAAERGRQLVAQLLAFGRQRTLEAKLTDPHVLIERMADVFRATLGSKSALRLDLGNVHEQVLVDPGQLELGLLNLVLNARDAMRSAPAGTLTIALSVVNLATPNPRLGGIAPGRYVQIRLSDTGVGMSEDVRERAFEPFFTTKSVGEGSGLGLSQTYGLVKQFKGAITLDSTVGAGTAVAIHLPVATPAAVPEREAARALASMPRLVGQAGRGRVLVVEDDALVRDFTAATLRDLGYEVLEAGDADVGWEILTTADRIDLLCTDIMMPGSMNGFQLAQKALGRRPDLRLVYMSGFPDKALESAKPVNGNVPYIAKPFSGGELAESLARAMTR